MATSQELQAQLDALKLETKNKEKELRKQIAKQKRQEEDAFIKAIGKLTIKTFPFLHSEAEFKQYFQTYCLNSQQQNVTKAE